MKQWNVLITGALLLGASASQAQWSIQSQHLVKTYNDQFEGKSGIELLLTESEADRNPYLRQTLEAAEIFAETFMKEGRIKSDFPGSQRVLLQLTTPGFARVGSETLMPAQIAWQKAGKDIATRDLIVYNPGIFQDINSPFTYKAVELLHSLGYHVLVIPNSFTEEYLQRFPVASPGTFEAEADLELQAIRQAKQLWSSRIGKIHVAGNSYGGFISAITTAKDQESDDPIIDGQLTIIGPQVKLARSLDLLDGLIDEYQKTFSPRLFARTIGYVFFKNLARAQEWAFRQYSELKRRPSPAKQYLPEVITAFEQIPDPRVEGASVYEKWRREIRFRLMRAQFTPETYDFYHNNRDELGFWISKLVAHGNQRFRILTTADDYTNHREDWQTYMPSSILTADHWLIRAHGSHNAFITETWFEDFMKATL